MSNSQSTNPPSTPIRFRAYSTRLDDFRQTIWVQCSHCAQCAYVVQMQPDPKARPFWRLTCPHCGHVKERDKPAERQLPAIQWSLHPWIRPTTTDQASIDPVFRLPLWLQTPCCNQILWAYNLEHLNFLELYVRSTLRERLPDDRLGWHNGSLASRLPRWMKLAKHRSAVLKAIQTLKHH